MGRIELSGHGEFFTFRDTDTDIRWVVSRNQVTGHLQISMNGRLTTQAGISPDPLHEEQAWSLAEKAAIANTAVLCSHCNNPIYFGDNQSVETVKFANDAMTRFGGRPVIMLSTELDGLNFCACGGKSHAG